MSIAFERLCVTVSFMISVATILSNWMGVGPCGWRYFFESLADRDSIVGIEEAHASFGFLSRGHGIGNDFAVVEDRVIQRWWWISGFNG